MSLNVIVAQHRIAHVDCILIITPRCRVLLEKLTCLQLVKKLPSFLWNPKVHYRTHKHPPPVPILGQPNPVHIPTSHLLEIHPNIIHTSTPRSPQWFLSLRFPHQYPIHPPLFTRCITYLYVVILSWMLISRNGHTGLLTFLCIISVSGKSVLNF